MERNGSQVYFGQSKWMSGGMEVRVKAEGGWRGRDGVQLGQSVAVTKRGARGIQRQMAEVTSDSRWEGKEVGEGKKRKR